MVEQGAAAACGAGGDPLLLTLGQRQAAASAPAQLSGGAVADDGRRHAAVAGLRLLPEHHAVHPGAQPLVLNQTVSSRRIHLECTMV